MLKYVEQHFEHQKRCAEARRQIEEEIEKRRERIKRAEKQIKKLEDKQENEYAYWFDDVVTPLMHDLEKLAGEGWYGEIYGPFGLECETSIYLRQDMSRSICDQPTYGLTIYPPDRKGVMQYQTDENTHQYPKGSIGELNGMNYVKAQLPDSIEEIWKLMKYSSKED